MLKFNDPLKKHLDAMKLVEPMKLADAMKGFQEPMKLADAMKGFQEPMKLADAMKGFRETMKLADPLKNYQDSMIKIREIMKFVDPLKNYQDSMLKIRETMKLISPTESFNDALKAINFGDQFGKLHQQIKELQSTINADSFENLIKEVQAINSQAGITQFGIEPLVNPNGTLSFSNDSVSLTSLQDVVEKVISNAVQDQSENIVQAFERLTTEVKSLKDTKTQKILIQLILPIVMYIILACFNPYADYHVKNYLNKTEKKQISKQINKAVVNHVHSREILEAFRYISADVLNVRQSKKINGKLLGYLYFGQLVEVMEKQKNWTKVKWVDETGENSIEGWVFTRYLKKFK